MPWPTQRAKRPAGSRFGRLDVASADEWPTQRAKRSAGSRFGRLEAASADEWPTQRAKPGQALASAFVSASVPGSRFGPVTRTSPTSSSPGVAPRSTYQWWIRTTPDESIAEIEQ